MRNRMTSAVPAFPASSWVASVVIGRRRNECGRSNGSCPDQQYLPSQVPRNGPEKAQAKADECLGRPGATTPKGSHWFYRIDRKSNRRCWYLGPVGQKVRPASANERAETAERPAAAARSAVPMPAPAPSALRADEETRAETPAATAATEGRNAAPADSYAVTATDFSAAWPSGASGGPYVPAASTATTNERSGRRGGRDAGGGHAAGLAGAHG